MSILTGKGITKVYGGNEVLHGIDLELESGKIYGLIGRNGAGKTTLLSILTSHNSATAGTVTFDGEPVWENPKVLEHLCFARELNQMLGVSTTGALKVKEYLRIASVYLPHWNQELADRLIKEFGLEQKKRLNKLSKGMLSMVTIIVALASKAEFTFLDEPVAGLDPSAMSELYELIKSLNDEGVGIIMISHDVQEAFNYAKHVLHVGDKVFFGTTKEYMESDLCKRFAPGKDGE